MQGPGKSWNLLGNDADAMMQAAGAEKLLILLSAVTCIGLYGLLCVIIVKKNVGTVFRCSGSYAVNELSLTALTLAIASAIASFSDETSSTAGCASVLSSSTVMKS